MEVNYYSKYLKYKAKYLELKAQLGGAEFSCKKNETFSNCVNIQCKLPCRVRECKCSSYVHTIRSIKPSLSLSAHPPDNPCKNCKHFLRNHGSCNVDSTTTKPLKK